MKDYTFKIGFLGGFTAPPEHLDNVEIVLNNGIDIIDLAKAGLKFKIAYFQKNKNKYKNYEDYCKENADIDQKIKIIIDDNITVSLHSLLWGLSDGITNPLHTKIVANHYGIDVVDFEKFKALNHKSSNNYMRTLTHVKNIEYLTDTRMASSIEDTTEVYVDFVDTDTKLIIKTDGATYGTRSEKATLIKMVANTRQRWKGDRLHFKANCYGLANITHTGTLSIERLLAGLHNIKKNSLLKNYENYEANVMDCSANIKTATRLGIEPFNFALNNIELCNSDDNKRHRGKIDEIYKKYNRVYAISALDPLWDLDSEWITLTHLDTYYRRVK